MAPTLYAGGQHKTSPGFSLKGIVSDSVTNLPIEMVIVSIPAINYWAATNISGEYVINNVPTGSYNVLYQILGYKSQTVLLNIGEHGGNVNVQLQPQSLALKDVTVTAIENKNGSTSRIESDAIRHIQPKSIADVFQLLPGQITENPSLSSPSQIKIREISTNNNSSLGALIIVDGVPMNNDANMQVFSSTQSGNVTASPGTVGGGIDLREVSAENIESVEVIRGIPSAEYGNLTSGVVLVKTKIGEAPWSISLKTDPGSKIASVSKGFRLKNEAGVINTGLDYTQSYDDIRLKFQGYKRFTGSLGFSNTYLKKTTPLSLNASLSVYGTVDENKSDPQLNSEELIRSSKKGFRMGINGKWLLRKSWITNIEYNISGDYAGVNDFVKKALVPSTGVVPYATAFVDSEYATSYLPGRYYSEYTMDGKPYNFFLKIKGDWDKNIGNIYNKALAGLDWSLTGNSGNGLTYDITRPPLSVLTSTVRPRAYKDLPLLSSISFFVEDKIIIPIRTTSLTLQAGARFVNVNPGNYLSFEPRFNADYEILNKENNIIFDNLSINGGYGISRKMPTLSYITPDNAYFDETSFNYYDSENGSLAVVTTHVRDTKNENLKPATNKKLEFGTSFKIGKVTGTVVGYYEKLTDGFGFAALPYFNEYRKFTGLSGAGKTPEYVDGDVYYYEDGVRKQNTYVMDTTIRTYNSAANNQIIVKKGVEYTLNVGKIETIQTSFVVDGAWIHEEKRNTQAVYTKINTSYMGAAYPYISILPAGSSTIKERINTNIRMITHIPKLQLVISLTSQIIWNTRSKYRWDDDNGNSYVYYYNESGERVYGGDAYDNMSITRYVDPIAFVDKDGVTHQWKDEYAQDAKYSIMISRISSNYYYVEEILPTAVQFNLRLTKEFAQSMELSFMANNFLKMNPYQLSNKTSLFVRRNTELYFGAELKYKF